MRRMVVLPDPFGPSSPMTSRWPTSKETSSTARWGPYRLLRPSSETTAMAARRGRTSVVEFRCLLHRLEGVRIMGGEEVRLLRGHLVANPLVGAEHAGRRVRQHDVRRDALLDVL